jgi:hypothetical protein
MIQEIFEQSEFLDNMDYDVEKETKIYKRKKKRNWNTELNAVI